MMNERNGYKGSSHHPLATASSGDLHGLDQPTDGTARPKTVMPRC